jgi:hypothetical protein
MTVVERLRSVGRLRLHDFTATPQERAAEAAEEALRLEAATRIEALERERAAAMKVIAAAREVADVVEGEKHVMAPLDAALAAFDRAAAASPPAPARATEGQEDTP